MKPLLLLLFLTSSFAAEIDGLKHDLAALAKRVAALEAENAKLKQQATFERLIVKKELIVSDTGQPWEAGFEQHQIPRGLYAKSLYEGIGGLWVRSRLIKGEIDDPFDDRFHAIERNGFRTSPGHISWNVWLDDNWRQTAIITAEGLELSEMPREKWSGGNHPGRLRFQTFRPYHDEPLTDVTIGQGKMSIGGGGFGGGGLPYPTEALEIWGGEVKTFPVGTPTAPRVEKDDASGEREYALIAVGPQGKRSVPGPKVKAKGIAKLRWDSVNGADSYIVLRDGKEIGPLRIEGAEKAWQDKASD